MGASRRRGARTPRAPELEALAARAARHLAEAGSRAHLRGDLPSEIAFLSRAVALLDRDDPARAELLPAVAAALFEAGSLDRAAAVADEALAVGERLGLARVRWRAAVERERLHVFRNPEAVEPDASLAVTRRAVTALGALGDDLGLARAYYVGCELVWLKGNSEMGYRNARRVLHHARRARSGFEIEAAISYMAWALVVNAVPVSDGIRECARPAARGRPGRYAALSVRGFKAVLDAMAGRFELARSDLATAREGIAELGFQQSSVWMAVFDAMAETLAGDAAAAERVLEDAERIAIDIGDRWFQSTILVDRAHAILAQDRPDAAAEAVARIDDVPAPRDMEWRVKRHAARGKLAALRGRRRSARCARQERPRRSPTRPRCSRSAPTRTATSPRSPPAATGTRRRARPPPPRSRCTRPRRTSPPRRNCNGPELDDQRGVPPTR